MIDVMDTLRRGADAGGVVTRLGSARLEFDCCDTEFVVHVEGPRAEGAARRARDRALALEAQLDAFDETSAVARLNREGRVENEHVAAVVRRGLEYARRTDGAFDVRHGETEHAVKEYIRDGGDRPAARFECSRVAVEGDTVTADRPLDLNGLAKGYVVDRATAALSGAGRRGFVDGGGDISTPTGAVAVESPFGEESLRVLDTEYNVATSGSYRRVRGDLDHVYDPREEQVGAGSDLVTVLARRDVTEADALATTLASMGTDEALALVEDWDGAEALVVQGGIVRRSSGFVEHVAGGGPA